MDLLIIIGTNRTNSLSGKLAREYFEILKANGVDSEIIDLAKLPGDFIASALYENSGSNPSFNIYREKMVKATKYVFIVPEYNGSFPGVLKAYIDGLKYPDTFRDKKCALVGLSSGVQGAGLALSHLTDIFNYCGMNVLALKPKLSHIESNMTDNKISNTLYKTLLEEQAIKFLDF